MAFATNLVQFPLGLVATALSFASLPVLARYGRQGARDPRFQRTLGMGMKAALLLIVPATVAMIVLREPLVRLLYQRGVFGAGGGRPDGAGAPLLRPPAALRGPRPAAHRRLLRPPEHPHCRCWSASSARGSTPPSPWAPWTRWG